MTIDPPIFDYDQRYFLDCDYSKNELFELQNQILSIINKGSSDIKRDLETKINEKEIDICLRKCYSKQLIQRERIGIDNDVPIYRYFTK